MQAKPAGFQPETWNRNDCIEYRAVLSVDDATWARGRGWALYAGVIALDYYRDTNPVLAGMCRRALCEVLADFAA